VTGGYPRKDRLPKHVLARLAETRRAGAAVRAMERIEQQLIRAVVDSQPEDLPAPIDHIRRELLVARAKVGL
jgi:hypothetical protein